MLKTFVRWVVIAVVFALLLSACLLLLMHATPEKPIPTAPPAVDTSTARGPVAVPDSMWVDTAGIR